MALTKEELAALRSEAEAAAERSAQRYADDARIVATGWCPDCGRSLRRNLAMTGWWQCSQFGADGFRADKTQPSCSFQCFTA